LGGASLGAVQVRGAVGPKLCKAWDLTAGRLGRLLQIEAGARTDLGRVRKNNEDCYSIDSSLQLYVLSDGMGGEAHGEVASKLAVQTVLTHCRQAENSRATPIFGESSPEISERTNRLASAIHLANRKVFETAASNPEQRGMGATIVAAWIEGQRLSLAHVGDSRAYLLRAGSMVQLTADHSLVAEKVRVGILTPQEADASEMQSVLTRAVGTNATVQVDANEQILLVGDTLLLCSDGLTRMVTDPEIASTLLTSTSAQEAADRLVDLANDYGGVDNVSAIVVRVTQKSDGMLDRLKVWKRNSG
jgi:serine/threonine protein phosphatase PrpC